MSEPWKRKECCCEWKPDENLMQRCLPRAMDMGHCDERENRQPEKPDYCCGAAYPHSTPDAEGAR